MPKAQAPERLDPTSLVARIIAELNENPQAQRMLLRAMLTNEFLGMPARLDAIEADVAEIKGRLTAVEGRLTAVEDRLTTLEEDVGAMKIDIAALKGDSLEIKIPRMIRPYLSQKMGLRRARIMQSPVSIDAEPELRDPVYDAADTGVITTGQEARIAATDLVLRARRQTDRASVWVVVEASNVIDGRDVERARESADALEIVFDEPSLPVVMGYSIRESDMRAAKSAAVEVFIVE